MLLHISATSSIADAERNADKSTKLTAQRSAIIFADSTTNQ